MSADVLDKCETIVSRMIDAGLPVDILERALPAYISVSAILALAAEHGVDAGLLFSGL